LSDFGWDLFESFSGSEGEAISHAVVYRGPAAWELKVVNLEGYNGPSSKLRGWGASSALKTSVKMSLARTACAAPFLQVFQNCGFYYN
jgi:hypothetical protein